MQEISENLGISRAAVSDTIKISNGHLENFETVLGISRQKTRLAEISKKLALTSLDPEQRRLIEDLEKELE